MRLRLVYLGLPETLLFGTKLAQILFDKYISFHNIYDQIFHTVVPSVDCLCNSTTKFTPKTVLVVTMLNAIKPRLALSKVQVTRCAAISERRSCTTKTAHQSENQPEGCDDYCRYGNSMISTQIFLSFNASDCTTPVFTVV
jgi:hypothetical protein